MEDSTETLKMNVNEMSVLLYRLMWIMWGFSSHLSNAETIEFKDEPISNLNWTWTWVQTGLPPGVYYNLTLYKFPHQCCKNHWGKLLNGDYTLLEENGKEMAIMEDFKLTVKFNKITDIIFMCLDFDVPYTETAYINPGSMKISAYQERSASALIDINTREIIKRSQTVAYARQIQYLTVQMHIYGSKTMLSQQGSYYSNKFAGFRCIFSQMPNDGKYPNLNLTCPSLVNTWEGGEIVMGGISKTSEGATEPAIQDCIWHVKPPATYDESLYSKSRENWNVFVRFSDVRLSGRLEVREGFYSTGKELLVLSGNITNANLSQREFYSSYGLYVRVIYSQWAGSVGFTYGAFVMKRGSQDERMVCYLHMKGNVYRAGFVCHSQPRCISRENLMDGIKHCPDGSDEDKKKAEHWKGNVPPCPVNSNHFKRCHNGQCVLRKSRCVDDPCPAERPLSCEDGMDCYSADQVCDGYPVCRDYTDENGCDSSADKYFWSMIGAVAVIISSVFYFTLCFGCAALRLRRRLPRGRIYDRHPRTHHSIIEILFQRENHWLHCRPVDNTRHSRSSREPPDSRSRGSYPMSPIGTSGLTFIPAELPQGHSDPPPKYDDLVDLDAAPPPYNTVSHIKDTSL